MALSIGGVAHAGDILRGGTHGGGGGRGNARNGGGGAEAARARVDAQDSLRRTTQAIHSVKAMQEAARAIAQGRPNLGIDPSRPGVPLPNVPNGLGPGGLQVAPTVPVTLPANGIPGLWTGAKLPTEREVDGETIVTIVQEQSKALLTWETFNIGEDTTLKFDQSAGGSDKGKWIAFNKINDPTGVPSQILGSIKADGQVYLINPNGIIFGGTSQVNLHGLVASSLPINDSLIQSGLLNNPDAEFLFSATTFGTETGSGPSLNTPDGRVGDVVVQEGARLTAPTTPDKVGGRIALVGANVRNEGTISTPDGQTILAAGLQVGFDAHPSSDPSLRGLDVYIGSVQYPEGGTQPAAGTATNTGLIHAARADVTIAGKTVLQGGYIESSTSSALNGRVDLLANYGATPNPGYDPANPQSGTPFSNRISGTVKIEVGSVIRILPELGTTDLAIGTQLALPSQVNVQGRAIHFANDSQLLAPNANVKVSAGNWLEPSAAAQTVFRFTGGQIYLDPGATINVAGSIDVTAPITNNILNLELRGTELAYSPLQREGVLRGPTISVDLRYSGIYNGFAWIGTPLGDVSGYAGIIQRSVGELTAAGGTVTLQAGESVVMQPGSVIDVSGGWINYDGGLVQTSRVVSGGTLYDLDQATPGRVYDSIYTGSTTSFNAKYGILETFSYPLALTGVHYESSYLHGADAGTITIAAPSMALDGTLEGHAVQGPRQSNSTAIALAKDGTLNINFRAQEALPPYYDYSPTPPTVIFGENPLQVAAAPFSVGEDGTPTALIDERKTTVYLSPDLLSEHGFGTLAVDNSDGRISIPEGIELTAPMLGTISLRAANLDIGGIVSAPGGTLSFSVFNLSPYTLIKLSANINTAVTPPPDPDRGIFTLGPNASLSTAGFITDYRRGALTEFVLPPLVDGGSISINAYTADLAVGSTIDVSGGVSIDSGGERTYGNGGSIAINAGRDPGLTWLLGGELRLGATLLGYSGAVGGALTIQAPMIQVGGMLPPLMPGEDGNSPFYLFGDIQVRRDELLYLTPDFFTQGGFTSYTLNGLGKAIDAAALEFLPAVQIAPGTVIRPVAESLLAVPGIGGAPVTLEPFLMPEGLQIPVSLTFGSFTTQNRFLPQPENILRGDIVVGEGALIETEPGGSVNFRGSTVAIRGSVVAPGGSITVSGADVFPLHIPSAPPEELKMALPTVHLAPGSVLSTAGETLLAPDVYGRRIGIVLPGGTIAVSGNIVAEAGALLDVSGASGVLDLAPGTLVQNISAADSLNGNRIVALNSGLTAPLYQLNTILADVASDAGTIVLRGGQELFTDATLLGIAGGPSARGGYLAISSGRYLDPLAAGVQSTPFDINLIVQQSGSTITGDFYPEGGTAIGHQIPVADGSADLGLGHFAVSSFSQGGFDSLSLSGQGANLAGGVGFFGPISIKARGSLVVSDGGVIFADSAVHLEASYVALGTAFESPLLPTQTDNLSFDGSVYGQPSFGPGSLTVRASLIDIGKLSLQNIGSTTLIADGGDIRGNGTLSAAGEVEFRAGQVYPTSGSQFTVSVYDPNIAVVSSSTASAQVTLASVTLPPGFGIGSPLLGSTVVSIDGTTVTLAANANANIAARTLTAFAPGEGTVTVTGSGVRPMPYSAGGTLSIYASNIHQDGTLRAPFGTINLGWDGTGESPIDYLTGAGILQGSSVAIAQELTLGAGSVTSVSGVDPRTRTGLIIPYGFSPDGTSWIDPTGTDITSGGPPAKEVNLSSVHLLDQSGSVLDLRGGGDLYVYRWVTGIGGVNDLLGSATGEWDGSASYTAGQLVSYQGSLWSARRPSQGVAPTISQDWTQLPQSFAVLPEYEANYAPYAAFNDRVSTLNLAISGPGYVSTGLAVGDRVYLGASEGLDAGSYTLLPARYALLPGAVLVTPQSGAALGTFQMPEGASIVSGYRYNEMSSQELPPTQATRFEVAPGEVVRARAQYDDSFANTFFEIAARELGIPTPLLPADSGRVAFSGLESLEIQGHVLGSAIGGGAGAQVDISTPMDILIADGGTTVPEGTTVLDAGLLSSFGADSILIGGTRQTTAAGTTITVNTGSLVVDNAGSRLVAPEIILVAEDSLTLAPDARIVQSGSTGGRNLPIFIGDAAVAGSGDGLLLRVSDKQTDVIRSGVSSIAAQAALANPPVLTIGAGARVAGRAITLDSTYGTTLDPAASILGRNIALNSGQILIAFDDAVNVPEVAGLTLTGQALDGLGSSRTLSLLSYSSIDIYGTGTFEAAGLLSLQAGQIRGFENGNGTVTFSASQILLGNIANGNGQAPGVATGGTLAFNAGTVRLGSGNMRIDQFANVDLLAADRVVSDADGSLRTQGGLTMETPVVTARRAVDYAVTAGGALDITAPESGGGAVGGGLGASLSLTGASVSVNSDILLPSGSLTLRATTGDLVVGNLGAAHIETRGTAQTFYDLTRYTHGGQINLIADAGSVTLGAQSEVSVAADAGGGNAGSVSISAANGTFTLDGTLDGRGGEGGAGGSFALDVKSLSSVTPIDLILNEASFTQGRSYRVRTGDVTIDGLATAHSYQLSADQGSITVTGTGNLDASGVTGGNIDLVAFGSVTVESGAHLSVAAENFNSAGQGGTISLEAGSQHNGVVGTGSLDLQAGSTLDLSVASKIAFDPATDATTPGTSAYQGQFSGKLHLRAPQNAEGTDLLVSEFGSTIIDASSILVEGYRLFDLTNTTGTITNTGTINASGGLMAAGSNVQGSIDANAQIFLGANGTTIAGYTAMLNRLLGNDAQELSSVFVLAPGAEVIHRTGDLTLGAANSTQTSDWNLSTFRYGPRGAAGTLTLRAAGNLVFYNTLSDGFTPTLPNTNAGWMYQSELTAQNQFLPINTQSWSYRMAAGADLGAADFHQVQSLSTLGSNVGSLQLGKLVTSNNGNPVSTGGANAQTATALAQRYQVIRTGSGDIDIAVGRDAQLLNQFATIYTAGTRAADPTLGGTFEVPRSVNVGSQGPLGGTQQNPAYAAQYSLGGGNVTIDAQQDIIHLTLSGGVLVADSQKQIPNNWLYRRGDVDLTTGEFLAGVENGSGTSTIASTSWWVDFSNFLEGIGTLGGGDVSLSAGRDVSNVDAVAATNARMSYRTADGDRRVANQTLLELGGGDVTVRAGNNIDAGIYYVERGQGTLSAGNSIVTNRTRSAALGTLTNPASFDPFPAQWLPTTLFLGKGGFDVDAEGDVLLGPSVNSFLLPVGLNNSFWRKSYLSTYADTSEINVSSLGGSITLRQTSTLPRTVAEGGTFADTSILGNWMQAIHLLTSNPASLSFSQPWLRLAETSLQPFDTMYTMLPGTVLATAFSGDINLVGRFNLSPSPIGTMELAAAGGINGLQPTGSILYPGNVLQTTWTSAKVNLSDADPGAIPGIFNPFGYQSLVGTTASSNQRTSNDFLISVADLFRESGSNSGLQSIIQTQQELHGTSLLHADDPEPLRIYAGTGNISGLTLFSAKASQIIAGNDISDIAFYIQNNDPDDISVISAGRDIVAYNANSLLRVAAQSSGNVLNLNEVPLTGDLQISGPGTLEVLAGRHLDLGTGTNNADGTGVGLTSIGNARNPNLPFEGADIIAAAGIGPAVGLSASTLDFDTFFEQVVKGTSGPDYLAELVETHPELPSDFDASMLEKLEPELRAKLSLEIFYLVLRDAGRNNTVAGSPGFGNYDAGFEAITALFGDGTTVGNISTRSRDIRTRSGGDISLLAPGGTLTLADSIIGTPLAPPGILTEAGGNISIFTDGNVDIGVARIFTLRGGNEIIWSSSGDIAAGSSSKTVQSAPPTRVLIDAQGADLKTDLAGLATGGGIGVLATVAGIPPGSVDLIAPSGVVDAGDAGIRATGDLNIAAVQVLNADNIQVGGTSAGVPTAPAVATPNLAGLSAASNATGAATSAANEVADRQRPPAEAEVLPSILTVEVVGYGGGDDEDEEAKRRRREQEASEAAE